MRFIFKNSYINKFNKYKFAFMNFIIYSINGKFNCIFIILLNTLILFKKIIK